jgi:hypothetical protein
MGFIIVPAPHDKHNASAELPEPTAYFPAEQAMQTVSAVDAVPVPYVPAAQLMHPSEAESGGY